MNINQLLAMLSKMDKTELEKNLNKAQQILNNSNIKKDFDNKKQQNYKGAKTVWRKIFLQF